MIKSNEEIWKPIKDYENLYEISNFGVIRKAKTKRPLKVFYRTNGYYTTSLCKNYKVTMIYLHRVIAETFIPKHIIRLMKQVKKQTLVKVVYLCVL